MFIGVARNENGKKTIHVDTRADKPNVVFFTDCGEKVDFHTQQLVGEIAFRLWHKAQHQSVNARDLIELLRMLSAIAMHHTSESS